MLDEHKLESLNRDLRRHLFSDIRFSLPIGKYTTLLSDGTYRVIPYSGDQCITFDSLYFGRTGKAILRFKPSSNSGEEIRYAYMPKLWGDSTHPSEYGKPMETKAVHAVASFIELPVSELRKVSDLFGFMALRAKTTREAHMALVDLLVDERRTVDEFIFEAERIPASEIPSAKYSSSEDFPAEFRGFKVHEFEGGVTIDSIDAVKSETSKPHIEPAKVKGWGLFA